MRLACLPIARHAHPGQFVNLKISDGLVPLLRKPFSVCRRNAAGGWFEILWKIVGAGTRMMSKYRRGDSVNVLGPLGKGFFLPAGTERAILVGGGLGVAPLPFLCEELLQAGVQAEVFLGTRGQNELCMVDFFEAAGAQVVIATEDGSSGCRGKVTEPLLEEIRRSRNLASTYLFSCGPTAFLKAMIDITETFAVGGQVSLETMMGCGFGICVGCPVQRKKRRPDEARFQLTCIDGPVFDAREVELLA